VIELTREAINVGCRDATFTDVVQSARIPLHILYPTNAAAHTERFGPYALDVAKDAASVGDDLPLVLISHGTGGTP
jgi:predicted dienelactone hydrolase